MAKVKIFVQKPFIFSSESGEKIPFETGIQEVEKEIAEHWFVQAHSVAASDAPKQDGNDHAEKQIKELQEQIVSKDAQIAELQEQLQTLSKESVKNGKKPDTTKGDGVQG